MHSDHRRNSEAKCNNLENRVLDTIKKYNMLESGDKVVVGVSGGPDSMTLLNILYNLKEKLNITIYVAHINHMIRKEADSETEYVINSCGKLGIEVFVKKTHVEDEAKKRRRRESHEAADTTGKVKPRTPRKCVGRDRKQLYEQKIVKGGCGDALGTCGRGMLSGRSGDAGISGCD